MKQGTIISNTHVVILTLRKRSVLQNIRSRQQFNRASTNFFILRYNRMNKPALATQGENIEIKSTDTICR